MSRSVENGSTQMVRTTMAIPIDIGGGQVAKINLPPGATLAGPVKVLTLPNQQTIAHVTVMAPPGVVERYVAQAAAESEATGGGGGDSLPKTLPTQTSTATPSGATQPPPATPAPEKPAPSPAQAATSPAQAAPSAPGNLFDKLSSNSKPSSTSVEKSKPCSRPRAGSSSSEDSVPLSQLSLKPAATRKKVPAKKSSVDKRTTEKVASNKKPQTGFGSFLELKRVEILQQNPRLSEKELAKEAKLLWEKLDIPTKNHYIRNSDAYKLKKGIVSAGGQAENDKTVKAPKPVPSTPVIDPAPPSQSKSELPSSKSIPDNKTIQEETVSGYNYPKRNVKRKYFDVEEDYDSNDTDWVLPDEDTKKNPISSPHAPTSIRGDMPPLKFKKKSKQSVPTNLPVTDQKTSVLKPSKVDKMAVNDDIDLPSVLDLDDRPSTQPPVSDTKTDLIKSERKEIIKEFTPPPPLRKIENAVIPSERKANLKLICLHDGCFEEAKTEPDRGKYWCSDKCCILYSKVIFNAWLGARRANMIE